MTAIIFYSMRSKGPLIVYSNYVKMEGLQIFKVYLKYFGFTNYNDGEGRNFLRYTEFYGAITDKEQRDKNRSAFNNPKNIDGSIINLAGATSAPTAPSIPNPQSTYGNTGVTTY